jgi:hypothetical protein
MHHIVYHTTYNTLQHKKESSCAVTVVWVVGVTATISQRAIKLVRL